MDCTFNTTNLNGQYLHLVHGAERCVDRLGERRRRLAPLISHETMYQLKGFRKSTLLQNYQLIV